MPLHHHGELGHFEFLDSSRIPRSEEIEEKKPAESGTHIIARRGLTLGALAFGSVTEIGQFYTGMEDLSQGSDKLLGAFKPNPVANGIFTGIYAAQAISINSTFTDDGIDTIFKIINGEDVPEWVKLPTNKARLATAISSSINLYGFCSDAAQLFYYLKLQADARGIEVNNGVIAAMLLISSLASASNIPTEALETTIFVRKLFAKKSEEKEEFNFNKTTAEKLANLLSIPVENVLKFFGALEDMIECYATIITMFATLFNANYLSVRWIVFTLSILNGFIDTMFNGKQSSDALELFRKTLVSGNYSVKEASAFLFSLFAATLVGQAQNSLIFQMLKNDVRLPYPLPEKIVDWLCRIFAYGAMAREIVNETYYFYPLVVAPLNYISRITQGPQTPSEFPFSYLHSADEDWINIIPDEEEEKVVLEETAFKSDDEEADFILISEENVPANKPESPKTTSCWANIFSSAKSVPAVSGGVQQKNLTLTPH